MSMDRVVVGYTATDAGADALALGARLGAALDAAVHVVVVLPSAEGNVSVPVDSAYDRLVADTARGWLRTALAPLPGIRGHVRHAADVSDGLVAAAEEFGAGLIVVGTGGGGPRGRHRLGTTAEQLVHSAPVPVALAPEGARGVGASVGLPRVTAAIGTRPGADVLLDTAATLARRTHAPLRLLSLAGVDLPERVDAGLTRLTGRTHAAQALDAVRGSLPSEVPAEAVVGTGDDIEDAVSRLDWLPGEVALVGSSRLAQPRRLFLGSTAGRILRALPVPMIVVPRTSEALS
ncbi:MULTISPECIES: universal stress protein [Microbacterium]|uniref:universal stress protein n=1 Tax=Microbacterium TaxID=33882 RepID=UPI002786A4EF|nr:MULTISPECIES: universal stress protein [Microbacterium]MDQ1084950.1 nucleotide-binding universal stress UspA family protein [Microbacterium sp. SORGH_AS_0344]MDQ1169773.1 nucleotide-binding universal stress UspA family protein [Microbacterium proteolyticum]